MRGFKIIKDYGYIPKRGTPRSAGYDLRSPKDVVVYPHHKETVPTGIAAWMGDDEVLLIFPRSSMGIKKSVVLGNSTGVIDSDYYGNESNGGEILVCLYNYGDFPITINEGDKIAQAVFLKYLTADNDTVDKDSRTGGIGSTGA